MRPSLLTIGALLLAALLDVPLDTLSKPLAIGALLAVALAFTVGAKGLADKALPAVVVLGVFTLIWPWICLAVQAWVEDSLGVAPRTAVGIALLAVFGLWVASGFVAGLGKAKPSPEPKVPSVRERVQVFSPSTYVPMFRKPAKEVEPEEDELGLFPKVRHGE